MLQHHWIRGGERGMKEIKQKQQHLEYQANNPHQPIKDMVFLLMASLVAQRWRIHLPMQERCIQPLGREDPLEQEMVTSSILAWEVPWTEEPGGATVLGACKVIGHDWMTKQQQSTWRMPCEDGGRDYSDVAASQGMLRMDHPLESDLGTLIWDLWLSELWQNKFLLF